MNIAPLSSFIAYELTPEEEIQAFTYSDMQTAGIQNLISAAAEEIVSVALTEDQLSLESQKKLAYTKGQIEILKLILARADILREQQKESQQHNSSDISQ